MGHSSQELSFSLGTTYLLLQNVMYSPGQNELIVRLRTFPLSVVPSLYPHFPDHRHVSEKYIPERGTTVPGFVYVQEL